MKKLIVITGGSKGIGKAILLKFAANGFDVVTCARKEADLQKMQQEVNLLYPEIAFLYTVADLSQRKGAEHFVSFVQNLGRTTTVLVNNAGYYLPGQVHNEPEGQLVDMVNANLYSAYHVTRGLVPKMIDAKQGHVFTICSVASIVPYVNGGSYCVSKFALLGFTKVLREELKPFGVRVTAVLPGATLTDSWAGVDLPEDRFISPEDIADAVFGAYSLSKRTVIEELIIRPQLGDI